MKPETRNLPNRFEQQTQEHIIRVWLRTEEEDARQHRPQNLFRRHWFDPVLLRLNQRVDSGDGIVLILPRRSKFSPERRPIGVPTSVGEPDKRNLIR